MSALFGFICRHLECARMKDARRARYGVYTGSVGYVNKFCSVWSFQCETLRLQYAFVFNNWYECVWCMKVNVFFFFSNKYTDAYAYQIISLNLCLILRLNTSLGINIMNEHVLVIWWDSYFVVCSFKYQHKLRTSIFVDIMWDIGISN